MLRVLLSRKSQESTYIFLRILPLSFLLAKRIIIIIIVKVQYAGLVSRIWTAEMEEYVGTNLLHEISGKLIPKPTS